MSGFVGSIRPCAMTRNPMGDHRETLYGPGMISLYPIFSRSEIDILQSQRSEPH